MTTVGELRRYLEAADGITQPGDPASMAPAGRLLWLHQVLGQLDLDPAFLKPADALRERAGALRLEATQASQQAQQRRASAVQLLAADKPASLAEAVAQHLEVSPWLDTQPTHLAPPAVELAEQAARLIESKIGVLIFANGEKIFALAQKKAMELVQEIADLPKFPDAIWGSPDPSGDLTRIPEHRLTWGTLTHNGQQFWLAHELANLVRDSIGAGANRLPDGAPRHAFWAKNWRPALEDNQFSLLKTPLRLRWALDHDWQPGLWRPEDVKATAKDATFGQKLGPIGCRGRDSTELSRQRRLTDFGAGAVAGPPRTGTFTSFQPGHHRGSSGSFRRCRHRTEVPRVWTWRPHKGLGASPPPRPDKSPGGMASYGYRHNSARAVRSTRVQPVWRPAVLAI
jgi:hypothetical protein